MGFISVLFCQLYLNFNFNPEYYSFVSPIWSKIILQATYSDDDFLYPTSATNYTSIKFPLYTLDIIIYWIIYTYDIILRSFWLLLNRNALLLFVPFAIKAIIVKRAFKKIYYLYVWP